MNDLYLRVELLIVQVFVYVDYNSGYWFDDVSTHTLIYM